MELQVPNSVIFLVRSSAHGESLLVELVIQVLINWLTGANQVADRPDQSADRC